MRRRVEIAEPEEVARLMRLPVEKRVALALRAHSLLRNSLRARRERQFSRLSRRELSLKLIEELRRDG